MINKIVENKPKINPTQFLSSKSAEMMILLWPTVMVVLLLLTIIGVVVPKFGDIEALNSQRSQIDQKTKQNVDKRNYLLSIDQTEMEKNADLLQKAIIQEKDSYFMVNVMRSLLAKHNFQIESFLISPGEIKAESAAKDKKKAAFEQAPITLSAVGPKSEYLQMLLAIEKNMPILSLNKMDLSAKGEQVIIDMTVAAYYVADNATINVNNLTLADLTLKKEEMDLFSKLSSFDQAEILSSQNIGGSFVQYQRNDPFKY